MRVYLANPLGFSSGQASYLAAIVARLEELGHEVYEPFSSEDFSDAIGIAYAENTPEAFDVLARHIAVVNENGINSCDAILGVLDGAELDSGTCWELGYAAAKGMPIYGLRTDFRNCGDFPGVPFNLQVLCRMRALFRSIDAVNF